MSEPRYWIERDPNGWIVMYRGTPEFYSMPFAFRDLALVEQGVASKERWARELTNEARAMRAALSAWKAEQQAPTSDGGETSE